MLLKTKNSMLETKLRTNSKRAPIERSTRASDTTFELFDTLHVLAGAWGGGILRGSKSLEPGENHGFAWKYKNSGNEAKKYLKTKHITFLNGANCACFEHKLAAI